MTWIVGTVPPFGYSILVSDIRVSWSNGTERDCLQKIYNLGNDYLCGFAGSVRTGFGLLNILSHQLPSKVARGPVYLAQDWIPSLCRRVFAKAPTVEKKAGCQLIVAAAHPTENLGDALWSRTFVWTFTYPDFAAVTAGPKDVLGIGNGSKVAAYVSALAAARNESFFLKLITHGEGAQTNYLAGKMHKLVLKASTKGVSPYMQAAYVTRGQAMFRNYDYTHFEADGRVEQVRVPPVATSYSEFSEYCRNPRLSAAAAVC